jgi:hypothetical protein
MYVTGRVGRGSAFASPRAKALSVSFAFALFASFERRCWSESTILASSSGWMACLMSAKGKREKTPRYAGAGTQTEAVPLWEVRERGSPKHKRWVGWVVISGLGLAGGPLQLLTVAWKDRSAWKNRSFGDIRVLRPDPGCSWGKVTHRFTNP